MSARASPQPLANEGSDQAFPPGPQNRVAGTLIYSTSGLFIVFFWLLFGDFAISMRERATIPTVLELLRQHNASNTAMSVLVHALPPLIGLLLVPVVAFKSDRHRGAWGRRIPFLLLPTPFGALAMVGLGVSPWLGSHLHGLLGAVSPGLNFCVLAVFAVFWTIFECTALVTTAMFTALINDVVPRGLLGRFYGFFRIISLGAGIIFNYWIFKLTETHLFEIFASIGVFFGVAFTLMCLMVKEGRYPDPLPDEPAKGVYAAFAKGTRVYFAECFSQRYYLLAFAALALGTLAPNPFNTFSQWYAESLGMPKATLGKLTATGYAASIGLAFFIGWLVDRSNALRVVTAMLALYALTTWLGFLFVVDTESFAVVYVLHTVISGGYFTAAASLPMLLFPRLRFSQFASAAGVITGLSLITLGLLLGPILDFADRSYRLTLAGGGLFAVIGVAINLLVMRAIARGESPSE